MAKSDTMVRCCTDKDTQHSHARYQHSWFQRWCLPMLPSAARTEREDAARARGH